MTPTSPPVVPAAWPRAASLPAATAIACILSLQLGLWLAPEGALLPVISPASGVALAALLHCAPGNRRALLWTMFTAAFVSYLIAGRPAWPAAGFALAHLVEAWACASLLLELFGAPILFDRLREVVALIAAAVLVCGCTALLAALVAALASGGGFWVHCRSWWLTAVPGMLLVAPLAAGWGRQQQAPPPGSPPRRLEPALLAALVTGLTFLAFDPVDSHWGLVVRPFLPTALIAWGALRLGLRGTVTLLLLAAVTALATTLWSATSPLGGAVRNEQLLWVQLYLACATAIGLLLAAALAERLRTEDVLRKGQSLLEAIVQGTTDAVYMKDPQGRYLRLNPAAGRFIGRRPEDVIGLDDAALFPPEEAARLMALDREVIDTRQPRSFEESLTTAGGQRRTLYATTGPVLDASREVAGLFGIARDVTAQKADEAALQRSETRFRSLYQSNVIGIGYWTDDGRVEDANDAYLALTGCTRADLRDGRGNWRRQVPPEYDAVVTEALATLEREGRVQPVNLEILRRDGTRGQVLAGVARLSPQDPGSMIAYLVDMTAQQEAEAARAALEAQVRHTQKLESLGVLAGGIAHDFNNLLQPILGHSDLLLKALPEGSQERADALEIRQAALRASTLTSQMLAYSGRGTLEVRTVDLNDCIRQTQRLIESSTARKATLQFHLASALPAVEADPGQLQQVAMNLIVNASEALDAERGGMVRIATGVQRLSAADLARSRLPERPDPGEFVYLEVTDTGCGMDATTLERLFDPFFSTKFTGRGLGMAVVQGIVRGHRGAILVDSTPGKGSRVTVLFPVSGRRAQAAGALEIAGRVAAAGRGRRVLLAEDDGAVRAVSASMLSMIGWDVVAVADGEEALANFRQDPTGFAAAVLDLSMPSLGGMQTLRALQRIRADLPVLLTSGYPEPEPAGPGSGGPANSRDGRVAFLQKPYSLDDLGAKLAQVLA
jgi:PAS domain S-box-containing protein